MTETGKLTHSWGRKCEERHTGADWDASDGTVGLGLHHHVTNAKVPRTALRHKASSNSVSPPACQLPVDMLCSVECLN